MRRAQAIDAHRPDEARDGACPRGARWPRRPVRDRRAVIRERDVHQDDATLGFTAPALELVVTRHNQQIGLETFRGRADAVPQPQHHQLARVREHDVERLASAHPAWHPDGLGAHVLQAIFAHPAQGPGDRVLERSRAAQSMTEGVGELRQPIPGGRVLQRRPDQPGRRFAIGIEPRDAGCSAAPAEGSGDRGGNELTTTEGHACSVQRETPATSVLAPRYADCGWMWSRDVSVGGCGAGTSVPADTLARQPVQQHRRTLRLRRQRRKVRRLLLGVIVAAHEPDAIERHVHAPRGE